MWRPDVTAQGMQILWLLQQKGNHLRRLTGKTEMPYKGASFCVAFFMLFHEKLTKDAPGLRFSFFQNR